MTIIYQNTVKGIVPTMLTGFFEGWTIVPPPEVHLRILHQSSHVQIAFAKDVELVVGFANAISDGFFSAFIPMVEVRQDYQHQGIGRSLFERLLKQLEGFYSVDLACDEHAYHFYEKFGMHRCVNMSLRNFDLSFLK